MRTLLLSIIVLCGSLEGAWAEADQEGLARDALTKVIRPGYEAFAADTKMLQDKTDALCAAPSKAALDAARNAFVSTVRGWSAVEIYQFGPVNREHRYERLFYWPDRKGLGLSQVQKALRASDEGVTKVETLREKSVALQGLPALEYLLYGDGADKLAASGDTSAFRCSFAAAIAANMAAIANEVATAWAPASDFTQGFLAPGPDDPVYRAPKDVTLELHKAFSTSIERVRDQKLGRVLDESPQRAKPRLAAFWRSGLSFPNMAGNLEAVRALFADGGFAEVVATQSPGVEDSVEFDLDRVARLLAEEQMPIAEAVRDPDERAKLEALRVALKSARETASELIAEGAGLSFGFNASDGD